MPATSVVQQQKMAIELERRKKGLRPRAWSRDLSNAQLEEFARTPTKGLPHRATSGKSKRRRRIAEMRA